MSKFKFVNSRHNWPGCPYASIDLEPTFYIMFLCFYDYSERCSHRFDVGKDAKSGELNIIIHHI